MNNVKLERLADICEIIVGRTPSRSESTFWGKGHPWVSIADMNQGLLITDTKEQITNLGAEKGKLIPEGTVLLSFKLSIGKVSIAGIPLYTNEAIAALIIKDPEILDSRYLMWTLKSMNLIANSNRAAMGATLNKSKLGDIQVPIPPIDEQIKKAKIEDIKHEIAKKRRRQQELFVELERARFIEEFGNPITNPKNLPTVRLSDIATITTGNSPSRSNKENFGNYIEWIKSNNLGQKYPTEAAEYLSEKGAKKARIAPAGSILVTCIAGSPSSIGKCSITDRNVAFNQQINSITPHDTKDLEFIWRQIQLFPELVQMKSTGGMKGLVSKTEFSKILILK